MDDYAPGLCTYKECDMIKLWLIVLIKMLVRLLSLNQLIINYVSSVFAKQDFLFVLCTSIKYFIFEFVIVDQF